MLLNSQRSVESQRWIVFLWSSCFSVVSGWSKILFDEHKWTTTSKPTCSLSLGLHFSFTFICKLTQYRSSLWSQKVRSCLISRPGKNGRRFSFCTFKSAKTLNCHLIKGTHREREAINQTKASDVFFISLHLFIAFSELTVDRACQHGRGIILRWPLACREHCVCGWVDGCVSDNLL